MKSFLVIVFTTQNGRALEESSFFVDAENSYRAWDKVEETVFCDLFSFGKMARIIEIDDIF